MKYDTLKAFVNAKVYENTEQRITGGDMNDVLQSAIASLGAHYQMGGLVSPTDHITVGDEPVVFIATTPGTYTYFGSKVVADGEVALLVWSGTAWSKQTPDIATRTEVSQLDQLLSIGYTFIDVAIPTTDPGNPEKKVFYIASNPGVYPNFGNLEIAEGEIVALVSVFTGGQLVWRKLTLGTNENDAFFDTETSDNFNFTQQSGRTFLPLNNPIKNGDVVLFSILADTAGTYQLAFYESSSAATESFMIHNGTFFAGERKFVKVKITGLSADKLYYLALNTSVATTTSVRMAILNAQKTEQSIILDDMFSEAQRNHDWFDTDVFAIATGNRTLVMPAGYRDVGVDYYLKFVSDADTKFNFELSTGASTSTITERFGVVNLLANKPFYLKFKATIAFARYFLRSVSTACNLRIEVVNLATIQQSLSALVTDGIDLGGNIVWNAGYYVDDIGLLREGAGYSYITPISVKKGDIIFGTHNRTMSTDRTGIYLTDSSLSFFAFKAKFLSGTEWFFVADEDCVVTFNKINSATITLHWYRMPAYANLDKFFDRLGRFYPADEWENKIKCISGNTILGDDNVAEKPVTLLHFSDIHASWLNMLRVEMFREKYAELLSDAIITGDMAGGTFPSYKSAFWNSIGADKILQVIGNHDVYDAHGDAPDGHYADQEYWATNAEKYAQYIAPNVAKWGVVQPANAATLGLCYYYKDYDLNAGADVITKNHYYLRMIVLDGMAFDSAQLSWMVSVLNDAKTNGYPVLIADHFPPFNGTADIFAFDTPFTSFNKGMKDSWAFANGYLPGATNAVDDFINAGGEFVCWICGHLHYDIVGTPVSHPNQIFISIGSAKYNSFALDGYRLPQFKSADLFNIMSVDVRNKRISVLRVGADTDNWMRHRGGMTIDYANRNLLHTW